MDIDQLASLVEQGMSQRQIARETGYSQTNIKYWLNKFGLQTIHPNGQQKTINQCRFCGVYVTRRKICWTCQCTLKRMTNKIRAVRYKGGECVVCGWKGNDEQVAGFEFHHTGNDKEFQVSDYWHYGWNKVKPELDKCKMLCSICHRILHNKLITSKMAKEAAIKADAAIAEENRNQ
ncbi:MAG: HNH endonuclease [Candidatus Woesebacteria bacterium GW2011_GWB1_39_12]|uniref:HNH endonuclease n=1 Tax=Candidatus Woesebacteria bacterium GW2011_GWB1_39_12 TaxID=1618574 RepID=A0A0G0MEU7_9BACT|nr:MAG: HNH endonuclease [Candidatus Woesebacteria bacterium GW2011_GWB1_39_12]